jgi:hypothetical protein
MLSRPPMAELQESQIHSTSTAYVLSSADGNTGGVLCVWSPRYSTKARHKLAVLIDGQAQLPDFLAFFHCAFR